MIPNMLISPMKFCYKKGFPVQNSTQNLDLSYKTDLDIWDCFERKNNPSYSGRNTVLKKELFGYASEKMQMEWQTVQTLIRLLL